MIIPYLKSYPQDDSTLGYGKHIKRQAQVLLRLFDEHVLGGYDREVDFRFEVESEFSGNYGIAKMITPDNPLDFDFEGTKNTRKALEEDRQQLVDLEIDATSESEIARQYCYKLRRTLSMVARWTMLFIYKIRVISGFFDLLAYNPSEVSRPLQDDTVKLFLEPSNAVAIFLLKNHNTGYADRKAKKLFRKNFEYRGHEG